MTRHAIALLTDFGLADPYVGQMKAVLATLVPHVSVLDLCHNIHAHDIDQAALFLSASFAYYPPDTLFITVVDPGVGTTRRLLYVETSEYGFLAPDNGVLGPIITEHPTHIWQITPHAEQLAFACLRHKDLTLPLHAATNSAPCHGPKGTPYSFSQVPYGTVTDEPSATFHGRDILAPLAALLCHGTSPAQVGHPIAQEDIVPFRRGTATGDARHFKAFVLHIDRFGNIQTNAPSLEWLPVIRGWPGAMVQCGDRQYPLHIVHTYDNLSSPTPNMSPANGCPMGLLPSSQGMLEIACNTASAAAVLNVAPGDSLAVYAARR